MPFYRKRYTKKIVRRVPRYVPRNPRTKMYYRKKLDNYPVPKRKLIKLKYVSNPFTINPAAGVLGIHIFSANGMYDPDISGVGHQPMGFDEWMSFYDHYTVLGSKITVAFTPVGATVATHQMVVGIYTDSDTTSTATASTMMEQPGTIYDWLGLTTAQVVKRVAKSFSTKKFFGQPKVMDNPELEGNVAGNPAEEAYFHVFAGALDGSSDPPAVTVNVQIDYIAMLTERKTLTAS